MYIIFFLICLISCTVGAVCGIGGGVIIKPVLDAFGMLSVAEVSFLSGCTVLAMTSYSVAAATLAKQESSIELRTSTPLAVGGAIGGVLGQQVFSVALSTYGNANMVGAIQAVCLFFLTAVTLLYTLNKDRIKTERIENLAGCTTIGLTLGIISSFLGIGGGPVNLVVLYYFFSMTTKAAAQNSLYIILFSQITSLLKTLVTGKVPEFDLLLFAGMAICGVIGGIIGRKLNKRVNDKMVTNLFICLMALIMLINVLNTYKFLKRV